MGGGGVHKHLCSHYPFFHKKFKQHSFAQQSYHPPNPQHKKFDKNMKLPIFQKNVPPQFSGQFLPCCQQCLYSHTHMQYNFMCSRMWVGLDRVQWNVDRTCEATEQIVAKTFACKVQHLLMAGCKYIRLCKYEYIF